MFMPLLATRLEQEVTLWNSQLIPLSVSHQTPLANRMSSTGRFSFFNSAT
jgi:hypothetical protein